MSSEFLVVGAGFSGAVLARELAENFDATIHVIEERKHVAGNCHTERDPETGVMMHQYGPHIFNTNREDVWRYVQRYGVFHPFLNRVKASTNRGIFSFPINLHTINQFFGKHLNPNEAQIFVASLGDKSIVNPQNFEEQALMLLGEQLYRAFFFGYTKKQWGCEPRELSASLLKRLPIRFSYDDNYYTATYQGMPHDGYTAIVERILQHPRIRVSLGCAFTSDLLERAQHVFYTGAIDRFFGLSSGRLSYRTIYFETLRGDGDFQGNPVINYPEMDVPYTRIHEHKHFAQWEKHARSTILIEHSKETGPVDVPYYPKRLKCDIEVLNSLVKRAEELRGVSFLGRLGTYRYLNMDQVIGEALDFAKITLRCLAAGAAIPTFPVSCGKQGTS